MQDPSVVYLHFEIEVNGSHLQYFERLIQSYACSPLQYRDIATEIKMINSNFHDKFTKRASNLTPKMGCLRLLAKAMAFQLVAVQLVHWQPATMLLPRAFHSLGWGGQNLPPPPVKTKLRSVRFKFFFFIHINLCPTSQS